MALKLVRRHKLQLTATLTEHIWCADVKKKRKEEANLRESRASDDFAL